jgi:transcriptional regulator with XRE-family HTH domain
MTIFERIKFLADKQKKSLNTVEEELGYGKNVLYRLKNTSPSTERLQELANYFGVSTDYLLGRTNEPEIHESITNPTEEVTSLFRIDTSRVDPDIREEVEDEIKNFSEFLIQQAMEKKARRERNNNK